MKAFFTMYDNGVTDMHWPTLEKMARERDAMQPFFADAILRLTALLEEGRLKGRTPADIVIEVKQ